MRVHPKTPYKWLRGEQPRSPWPALVSVLLTEDLGRDITPVDLGWDSADAEAVSAISGLVLPWTATGSLHAMRAVTDAGTMQRRIVRTLLGAAVTTPAHEWLLARPDDTAALARSAGSPLPVGVVDELDAIVGRLRVMDDQVGSGTLLLSHSTTCPSRSSRTSLVSPNSVYRCGTYSSAGVDGVGGDLRGLPGDQRPQVDQPLVVEEAL